MNAKRWVAILTVLLSCSWSLAAEDWQGFFPARTVSEIFTNGVLEGVADFNGDGDLDILVRNSFGDLGLLLLGDGKGRFSAGPIFGTGVFLVEGGFAQGAFALGDFNRDGMSDYAVGGIIVPSNAKLERVRVALGRGDGTFLNREIWSGLGYLRGVAAGDFNQDNLEDLAVTMGSAEPGAPQGVLVFLGRGDGTFDPPRLSPTALVGHGAPIVADFTGDLVEDLVLNGSGSNVLAGDGQGGFAAFASVPLGGANVVMGADLDGDGAQDLVTGNSIGHSVSVLLGHGDGSFEPAQAYDVGNSVTALATADFDSDGATDIAVAFDPNFGFAIQLGYGDGSFMPDRRFEGGGRSVAVGDFDKKKGPDVATLQVGVDPDLAQVLIHRNRGLEDQQ